MYVLIVGGGRTGSQLARFLLDEQHEVRVIENRKAVLSGIHRELPTEVVFEGDPIDLAVLEKAGIQDANVLAACTASDDINLVLCYLAREKYGVRRTIARVNHPHNAWLFNEIFR
ncbi:MAG: TrkA family potassium uptake protein, partial [Chloroflexi bacterium]|nr:TrkA family potassium uptake protein [Chloroflexota bacterium]